MELKDVPEDKRLSGEELETYQAAQKEYDKLLGLHYDWLRGKGAFSFGTNLVDNRATIVVQATDPDAIKNSDDIPKELEALQKSGRFVVKKSSPGANLFAVNVHSTKLTCALTTFVQLLPDGKDTLDQKQHLFALTLFHGIGPNPKSDFYVEYQKNYLVRGIYHQGDDRTSPFAQASLVQVPMEVYAKAPSYLRALTPLGLFENLVVNQFLVVLKADHTPRFLKIVSVNHAQAVIDKHAIHDCVICENTPADSAVVEGDSGGPSWTIENKKASKFVGNVIGGLSEHGRTTDNHTYYQHVVIGPWSGSRGGIRGLWPAPGRTLKLV